MLFLFSSPLFIVEANPIGELHFLIVEIINFSCVLGICFRNCAQCKKMFGPYFEGQLCADACVKFKGKIIPDCEDIASIAPFISRFD